jgi:hypothetical protein
MEEEAAAIVSETDPSIATETYARRIWTARGGEWNATQVQRVLARAT